MLAVPKFESVVLLERDTWEAVVTLNTDKLIEKEIFTCVEWNKEGDLIIAGTSKVDYSYIIQKISQKVDVDACT